MAEAEILYRFHIDAVVKNYKSQRNSTAPRLTPVFLMECHSVEDFKEKLWNKYSEHIKGKAVIPINVQDVCTVEVNSNTIANIGNFIFFEKSKRKFMFMDEPRNPMCIKNSVLQYLSTPIEGAHIAVVEMTLYSYGDSVINSDAWERFSAACIRPLQTDRGGATAEQHIQAIIVRLQGRWRGIYFSENINWRIWATEIARLSTHDQEIAIQSSPPYNLIHMFRHAPENREQRFAAITRGMGLANVALNQMLNEFEQFEEDLEALFERQRDLRQRFKMMKRGLEGQINIVRASEAAMTIEETPIATEVIRHIPEQDDTDHVE